MEYVDLALEFIWKATQNYEYWWLNLYHEAPQHILIETGLLCFIIWLVFIRKTVDPTKPTDTQKFTAKEIQYLVDTWEPEPIVKKLPEKLVKLAENVLVIEKCDGKYIQIEGVENPVLNLSSFDFLGMSSYLPAKDTAKQALEKYGCGSCGPRGFYGTIDQHLLLEQAVASFLGVEEAILYSDGASTVTSAIAAFAKKGDILVVDAGCSEPILMGALLSRSTIKYYKHNDTSDLEAILKSIHDEDLKLKRDASEQRRFVVTEGLFRNTGNICNLPEILRIKEKYFYRLILDDSVAFGSMGATGKGTTEYHKIPASEVEIIIVALDTALASVGGLCVGTREITDHQRLSGAGYCYSASAPPFLCAAATTTLKALQENPKLLVTLQENATVLFDGINKIKGLQIGGDKPAPVMFIQLDLTAFKSPITRDEEEDYLNALSETLLNKGVGILIAKFSLVADHAKKMNFRPALRVCASALLTKTDLKTILDKLKQAVKSVCKF